MTFLLPCFASGTTIFTVLSASSNIASLYL
jgi:hypothetical protein